MTAGDLASNLAGAAASYIASGAGPTSWQFAILHALQSAEKHVYEGTVAAAEKRRRRAKAKAAKAARKVNRCR